MRNSDAWPSGDWPHYTEELRRDWLSARDGKTSLREFHDQLLDFGGPPVPLVRRIMLGGGRGSLFQGLGRVAYAVVAICPHLKIPYFT